MKIKRIILTLITMLAGVSYSSAMPQIPARPQQTGAAPTLCCDVNDPSFDPELLMHLFTVQSIDDNTFERMKGRSFGKGCTTRRSDLRYLFVPHYDGHGHVRLGEMVCNKAIAADLIEIFKELFLGRYPIEKMVLIDEYDGDDELSMRDNNTSCFNFRRVDGKKSLSRHARGMAVDINPFYNPYVHTVAGRQVVSPAGSARYADRSLRNVPYMISRNDICCRLFRARGFAWGGNWRRSKDYQHFQK